MSETDSVRVAGSGPGVEAVVAAVADADGVTAERVGVGDLSGATLGVAVGDEGTLRATTTATAAGTPVVGVELGGVGGQSVAGVEAAVLGLSRTGACYECVRTRVAAGDPEVGAGSETDPATARLAGATAGRAAVAHLRGDATPVFPRTPDGDAVGGVVEVPHAARQVLPVPGCDCDDGDRFDPAGFAIDDVDRPPSAAVERAELALDERVGPLATVGELESFPVPYYVATLSATDGFSDASAARKAGGAGADWNRALMRALGEGLERYTAGVYRAEDCHRAPPRAVPAAVGPDAFVRPEDAAAVDPETPIRWMGAVDLSARLLAEADGPASGSDDLTYVPAEAVLFPPPEQRYLARVTTGLGLGNGTAGAVRSGLTEVVERDATMVSWYSTLEPLEIAVEDEAYETLVRRARSEGLTATARLVTVDVDVPVVAATVHREGEWPRFAAGSAAALDPAAAARDALTEALQNWTELRSMGRSAASDESTAIGRYAEDPGPALRRLDGGGPVPAGSVAGDAPETPRAAVRTLVERVSDAGLTPYATALTPRDVERAGFAAVRVLVPGAQPLFVDVDRPTFGERAETVPAALGCEPRLDGPPHPYP